MHRFDAEVHYFFVPHRILWSNWERFITQRDEDGNPVSENELLVYLLLLEI